MADQNILDYLRENKNKFPQEVLKKKLIEAGYPKEQIEEGIKIIYEGATIPPAPLQVKRTSFWDFKNIKVYQSFEEKILDFLAGFFTPIIIFLLTSEFLFSFLTFFWTSPFLGGFLWILYLGNVIATIFGAFYFWRKRHYFARGLLFLLILPLIIIIISVFFSLLLSWH